MSMERPEYLDWIREDLKGYEDLEDEIDKDPWDYFETFDEFPPGDATDKTIVRFVAEAKKAGKAIKRELMEKGKSEKEAEVLSCQWPIKDNAPMRIIREYIGTNHDIHEAAKQGIDL